MEALNVGWWLRLQVGFGIGSDFLIVRDGSDASVRGQISRNKASAIRTFVRDEFPPGCRFAVVGRFGPGRTFRLRWAGGADPTIRQRLRNVLVDILR